MKFIMICSMMLSTSLSIAQNATNTHFSHTLHTTAAPEKIWGIWTDVPKWNQWDDGLKSATLQGDFKSGAKGLLIPDKGPKSKFSITAFIPDTSYTFKTKLPLGALYVKRTLNLKDGKTYFTHEVWFTGLTKGLFGSMLGKKYRAILPSVMEKIRSMAEE